MLEASTSGILAIRCVEGQKGQPQTDVLREACPSPFKLMMRVPFRCEREAGMFRERALKIVLALAGLFFSAAINPGIVVYGSRRIVETGNTMVMVSTSRSTLINGSQPRRLRSLVKAEPRATARFS